MYIIRNKQVNSHRYESIRERNSDEKSYFLSYCPPVLTLGVVEQSDDKEEKKSKNDDQDEDAGKRGRVEDAEGWFIN